MAGKDVLGVNAPLLSLADLWLAVTFKCCMAFTFNDAKLPPKAFEATLM